MHAAHAMYKTALSIKPTIESTKPAVAMPLLSGFFLPKAPRTIPMIPRIIPS